MLASDNEKAKAEWMETQWQEKLSCMYFYDDKVPYAKLKVCRICRGNGMIDIYLIMHRDKNACINILNKFIMLLKNEKFPKALDRN